MKDELWRTNCDGQALEGELRRVSVWESVKVRSGIAEITKITKTAAKKQIKLKIYSHVNLRYKKKVEPQSNCNTNKIKFL